MDFELKSENQNLVAKNDFFYFQKNADRLISCLPKNFYGEVAEIKLGENASIFKQTANSPLMGNKTIFEIKSSPNYVANLGSKLIPNSCELPVDDSSIDLALQSYLFNSMRMDQVYMVCAELRRALKKGGYWGLVEHSFGKNIFSNMASKVWKKWHGHSLIDANHYISPEDWEIEYQEYSSHFGISSQILILRRV